LASFRYIIRLAFWLFREWIAGIVGIVLVLVGALPSSPDGSSILKFAAPWVHNDWARWGFVGGGLLVIFLAVYRNIFEYGALKSRLRTALLDMTHASVEMRLHAISEILEISRNSRRLHQSCMQIFSNYLQIRYPAQLSNRSVTVVRRRFGTPGVSLKEDYGQGRDTFINSELEIAREDTPIDARAVVEAVAQRRRFFDDPRHWIDLSSVNLPSIDLEGYHLGRVSFAGSNLRHGHFDRANLSDAVLDGAILSDASFRKAKLDGTSFKFIRGHRANFDEAHLRGAKFFGADLHDSYIQKANARQANFHAANLWRLDAGLTDFAGALFYNADIRGAHLNNSVNLSKEQIFKDSFAARFDHSTVFPWSTQEELRKAGIFSVTAQG
jgi:uncharacterized protein YjbI with pentapeptide repeats